MAKLPPGTPAVGIPRLRFERIVSTRLRFIAETTCIHCGRQLLIEHGVGGAVFRAGNEFIGIVCDECLDHGARTPRDWPYGLRVVASQAGHRKTAQPEPARRVGHMCAVWWWADCGDGSREAWQGA